MTIWRKKCPQPEVLEGGTSVGVDGEGNSLTRFGGGGGGPSGISPGHMSGFLG